ncbi:unnamed protein product [Allacma fusca]|uniref:BTB domain-containing protein n=1 Tax=Allacma fusca TaxID=39272 RepID=A0A8J2PNW7_9HEXA|nr:unnamed protein product [Allacma fusca]
MDTLYSERTSYSVHTVTLSLEGENAVQPPRASSFSSKTPFQFFGKLLMQNTFDSRHKEEFLRVEVNHEANQEHVDVVLHKYRFAVDRTHNFDFDGEATIYILKPNEGTPADCTTPPKKMTMSSVRSSKFDPTKPSTSIYQNCFTAKSVIAAFRESFSYPNIPKEEISQSYGSYPSVKIELKMLFQIEYKYTLVEAHEGLLHKPVAPPPVPAPAPAVPPPVQNNNDLSTLTLSFKKMLDEAIHADVQLEVENIKFPAHMAILSSQSEVFKVMFESNMIEKKSKRVIIRDMSPGAVKEMLNFLYTRDTSQFEDNIDMAIEMLHAAEKYIIGDLRRASEEALQKHDLTQLGVDDILGLYMCSRQLKMPQEGSVSGSVKSIREILL